MLYFSSKDHKTFFSDRPVVLKQTDPGAGNQHIFKSGLIENII